MSDKSSHGVFFLDLLLFVDITNHFLWSDYTIAKHRLQVGILIKKKERSRETRGLKKATKIILIIVIAHIAFFASFFLLICIGSGGTAAQKNNAEEKRLNAIVQEVDDALENHDYKLAMRIVESMKYTTYDKERERWWGVKKESMIDEIIDEAHKDGVEIERPADTSITTPPTTSDY